MTSPYHTIRGGRAYHQGAAYREQILQRDGYRCQLCGCRVGEVCDRHYAPVSQLDAAHVIPFKDGGLSTPSNQRAVCHPCNKREGYGTEHKVAVTWP